MSWKKKAISQANQGKGFYVMPSGSELMREQLIKEVEQHLNHAIAAAHRASMSSDELASLLKLLQEVSDE